jgi:hypothetical protein
VLDAWAATGSKVPLYHVPNHRNQVPPWGCTCAGYNTGFMLSEGPLVIMLCDYAYCGPEWIWRHVEAHVGQRRVVMAPHDYRPIGEVVTRDGSPPLNLSRDQHPGMTPEAIWAERSRYDEISLFPEPFDPARMGASAAPPHCDPKMFMAEGPDETLPFHTKNESFPLDNVLAVNGMDEHYDRMGGPGDPELAHRLVRSGLSGWIAPRAVVQVPNVRWVLPNPNAAGFHDRPIPGHEWRGDYLKGEAYFQRSMAEQRRRAPNPFEIEERREVIWKWREMSQERDAIIPEIVVPDGAYFLDG